jgi:hypothetical protein
MEFYFLFMGTHLIALGFIVFIAWLFLKDI